MPSPNNKAVKKVKYFMDKILYKIQDYKWFWRTGLGKKMLGMKDVYATQFARSKAFRGEGYSVSGGVTIFIDHIFLTRQLAEEVYEDCIERWRPADTENGYIHDDDLVLWEYNNGYSKELRNYQTESLPHSPLKVKNKMR